MLHPQSILYKNEYISNNPKPNQHHFIFFMTTISMQSLLINVRNAV